MTHYKCQVGESVYLLTSGEGDDGDPWTVHGIYSAPGLAEEARRKLREPNRARVDEWPVDESEPTE